MKQQPEPEASTGTALLRPAEVGRELRLSPATVYRLISEGQIPVVHIGARRATRVRRADLTAYIERLAPRTESAVRGGAA